MKNFKIVMKSNIDRHIEREVEGDKFEFEMKIFYKAMLNNVKRFREIIYKDNLLRSCG